MAEKERLNAQSEQTKGRLVRAEKLTSGLSDESVRWKEAVWLHVPSVHSVLHPSVFFEFLLLYKSQ